MLAHQFPRRTAVGLAVAACAACAGCTRYGPENPAPAGAVEETAGQVLGVAKDVPVGGGAVFRDAKIVVTQPVAGQFTGFSAVCTHQGCVVAEVKDGTINCDCHGSKFGLDGTVKTGPATLPLPPKAVTVNAKGELTVGAAEETTTAPPTEPAPEETTTEAPVEPPPPPAGLAATGDIPVGGGAVFEAEGVVITQPTPGEFRAFSAVCTHQGCVVADVTGGTINCNCHGSKFALDGSVATGPATKPLPTRAVKVSGDQISLA
jgi:Rieske Fe-S protein